jgi:hypothetical protein
MAAHKYLFAADRTTGQSLWRQPFFLGCDGFPGWVKNVAIPTIPTRPAHFHLIALAENHL